MSCARKHLYSAQKCFHPAIYTLVVHQQCRVRKYLFACADILGLPRKYFGLRGNILACAEIFSLPAENYMLRENIFKSRANFLFARGNYQVPTILGMPECRDQLIQLIDPLLAASAYQAEFQMQVPCYLSYLICYILWGKNISAHCTNVFAHKIYFHTPLLMCK